MRKFAFAVASVLVVALIAGSITAFTFLRRPLPATSGELQVPGLTSEVEVLRDELGIPQIYADNSHDLFFAQGFVHAQDRFFEMDYRRHVTAGRMSELVGENETALNADKVIRTLGWRQIAEAEWSMLSAEAKAYYTAYADGVNAYISDRSPSALALEYTVLGFQVEVNDPEPWTPIDSLTWLKAMAWDLLGNYSDEVTRAAAYASVGDVALVNQLYPTYPSSRNLPILPSAELVAEHREFTANPPETIPDTEVEDDQADASSVSDQDALPDLAGVDSQIWAQAAAALDAVPNPIGKGDGIGSNSWVISGEHTESGAPLLANDPHLGLAQPGVWYQVGLHCRNVGGDCPFQVAGFSFAGLPGVVIGHNEQLGWGLTNMGSDAADLFLHRTYTDGTYLRDGERVPLETRTEVIRVNGAEDVMIEVRETVHGPLISDVLASSGLATGAPLSENAPPEGVSGYAVALAWTALEPGMTGEAIFAVNAARDANDIGAAAALFEVPTQNIIFATTDGDIGYQAPGKVPVRDAVPGSPVPTDGSWPRMGWDSRYDWQGFVPHSQMPSQLNPEEGFIVAANQMVQAPGTEPFFTNDADYGYRSQAIRDAIEAQIESGDPFTVADMNQIQLISHNPFAEMLVPILLDLDVEEAFVREAVALLETWDHTNEVDSAAAAYFEAVWVNILELTFWDQLPAQVRPTGGSQWLEAVRFLLADPENLWWDDITTVNVVEQRDEVLIHALTNAREQLTVQLGKNPQRWEWGKLHQVTALHPVLGGEDVPGIVRALVNGDTRPVAGGSSIVNAQGYDAAARSEQLDGLYPDFSVTWIPSMRAVYDLGDWNQSTWIVSTGNSGHPIASNYDSQFADWVEGGTNSWAFTPDAVDASDPDRLVLTP